MKQELRYFVYGKRMSVRVLESEAGFTVEYEFGRKAGKPIWRAYGPFDYAEGSNPRKNMGLFSDFEMARYSADLRYKANN